MILCAKNILRSGFFNRSVFGFGRFLKSSVRFSDTSLSFKLLIFGVLGIARDSKFFRRKILVWAPPRYFACWRNKAPAFDSQIQAYLLNY
jgi:hypothetical protein